MMKALLNYIQEGLFRDSNETREERFKKDLIELLNKKIGGKLYSTTRLVKIFDDGCVKIAPSRAKRNIFLDQYYLEQIIDDLKPLKKLLDLTFFVEDKGNLEIKFGKYYNTIDFNGICCKSINKLIFSDPSGGEFDCIIKNLNAHCDIIEFNFFNSFNENKPPHFIFENCTFNTYHIVASEAAWNKINITSNKTILMVDGSKEKFEDYLRK